MNQIFTSFNESYRILAAACIASLFKHTGVDVEIIILDTGIKESTRKIFERWALQKKRILKFYPISVESYTSMLGDDIQLPVDFHIEYYPKLLVPYYADKNAINIFYIDADTICLRDPSAVFSKNLAGNIIGAVQDHIQKVSQGISNYKEFSMEGNEPYFNAGVLLIDIEAWKSKQVSKNALLIAYTNQNSVTNYDQYSLNIVLCKKWEKLANYWNEMDIAKKEITIFRHFAGVKPLSTICTCQDAYLFFEYLQLSPYFYFGWKRVKFRLYIAKLQWKLKFFSNQLFRTNFNLEELNI